MYFYFGSSLFMNWDRFVRGSPGQLVRGCSKLGEEDRFFLPASSISGMGVRIAETTSTAHACSRNSDGWPLPAALPASQHPPPCSSHYSED